jgi:hypothetical protein
MHFGLEFSFKSLARLMITRGTLVVKQLEVRAARGGAIQQKGQDEKSLTCFLIRTEGDSFTGWMMNEHEVCLFAGKHGSCACLVMTSVTSGDSPDMAS